MFFQQGNARAVSLLQSLGAGGGQSRAVLLLGPEGSGKFSAALDFAQSLLKSPVLSSSDFFCFRNDRYALKAVYFSGIMAGTPLAHHFWMLFQRRIAASILLGESLSLPSGLKLASVKEELDASLSLGKCPEGEKTIQNLIDCAKAYGKKSGIPMDIIREAIGFHSMHSEQGRVSIFGGFDTAEENTQNAALKLLEEPHPKHWIILTAADAKRLIPTVLSRVITVMFSKPRSGDLACLQGHRNIFHSSIQVMEESVNRISALKNEYLKEFFVGLVPQIDKGWVLFSLGEKLEKAGHAALFTEELLSVLADALILRRARIMGVDAPPLLHPERRVFAESFIKGSSAELEDLALQAEAALRHLRRPVIKGDSVLPALFLSFARQIRIFSGRAG